MYPGIELRTMRYIVAVGSELHFTRAAERVRVAQPSLSKQIRNVEEELGVELFKRTRKKVEVTEPGRVFIENAQQALLYADRAASMARAAGAGQLGKLLLGVSPLVDLQLFFRIRDGFEKRYPEVQFQFVTGLATEQAEWVMRSELHAGLIELPIRCRGLAVLNVSREPLLLALQRMISWQPRNPSRRDNSKTGGWSCFPQPPTWHMTKSWKAFELGATALRGHSMSSA